MVKSGLMSRLSVDHSTNVNRGHDNDIRYYQPNSYIIIFVK